MEAIIITIDAYRLGECDLTTVHTVAQHHGMGASETNELLAWAMSEATGASS